MGGGGELHGMRGKRLYEGKVQAKFVGPEQHVKVKEVTVCGVDDVVIIFHIVSSHTRHTGD